MNNSESFEINLVGGVIQHLDRFNMSDLINILTTIREDNKEWAFYNSTFNIKNERANQPLHLEIGNINKEMKKNVHRYKQKKFKEDNEENLKKELKSKLKDEIKKLARSSQNINNDKSDLLNRAESIANIKAALALI